MKTIITAIIMLIVSTSSAQVQADISALAKQQIIKKAKLPIKIGLLNPQMIGDYQLDTIAIEFTVSSSGRAKNITVTKPTQQAINDIIYSALRKVKLPKSNATQQLSIGFKLLFTDTNEISSSIHSKSQSTTRNYKIVDLSSGVPRSNKGYQVNAAVPLVIHSNNESVVARKDISIQKTRRLSDINNTMTKDVVDGQKNPTGMHMFIVNMVNP